jgi:hypothetical protein
LNSALPAGLTQGEPPFPAVLAGSNGDPASAPHDSERTGERGAIDGQNLPERSLGNFTGEGQCLQKSELRGSQAQWPESPVVVLAQHARGPTETRAHAGKNELLQLTHTEIDVYTLSAIQEIVLVLPTTRELIGSGNASAFPCANPPSISPKIRFVVALPWHRKKVSTSNDLLYPPVGPLS